jgi:perosamine synthetase
MAERPALRLRSRAAHTTEGDRPDINPALARDKEIIRVAEPLIGPEEAARVAEVVASTLVSSVSPAVSEFEARLATQSGATDAIAVTCGTHALDLLMYALDVGPGDEVIVPALTFISVGATVARAGARPVFVDVSRTSLNMLPEAVEAAITHRTRGIIGVHTYGHPCDMDALQVLADRHGLFLLEDACEALGGSWRGRPVGSFGDAAVHSFYSNKMMTTGNGGAITTSRPELAALLRELRGYSYAPGRFFWHEHMPFNVRMSGLQAAVGLAQLDRLGALVNHHEWMAAAYAEGLKGLPGITQPAPCAEGRHVYWMVTIHVDEARYGLSAHALRVRLAADAIETRPVFTPLHVQPVLQERAQGQGPFPNASWAARTGINLPSGATLTPTQLGRVCEVIRHAASR